MKNSPKLGPYHVHCKCLIITSTREFKLKINFYGNQHYATNAID